MTGEGTSSGRSGVAALLVAGALAVGGCGDGGDKVVTERTDGGRTRILRLESQTTVSETVLVSPARSIAQQLIIRAMVFKAGGSRAIGRSQGACTRTQPGGGQVFNCQLAFVLPTGVIYAQAVASLDGPSAGIVAGGTESYRDARGTFLYARKRGSRVELTMTLRT